MRLESQLQRELAELLQREISDPRAAGVTVTRAKVSPDLRNATVYINELGSDGELDAAISALGHAQSRLRRLLGQRLRLRRIPALRFVPDRAMREGDRVAGLIRAAVQADQHAHEDATPSAPPGPCSEPPAVGGT